MIASENLALAGRNKWLEILYGHSDLNNLPEKWREELPEKGGEE